MNVTKELLARLGCTRKEFDATTAVIVALLKRSDKAVEQAILRIYDRQTRDEKAVQATTQLNGIGFQACDARRGTYWARLILGGRHLFADRMPKARAMVIKYRVQLTVLAFEKKQKAERERQARLDRMSCATTFNPEDLEREMQAMEAEADRAQSRREEAAKAAWKGRVER
jgi:hypothetical protein